MNRVSCLVIATVLSFALCGAATAEVLSVDFQPTGGDTATGFQAFDQGDKAAGTSHSYSAFGATIDVALSASGRIRAFARTGDDWPRTNPWTIDDGLSPDPTDPSHDSVSTDTASGTLTITVSGLPEGDYTWLSQHNDGTHPSNGNQDGDVDYALAHAGGTVSGVYNVAHASHRNFASGGSGTEEDPYTIQNYEPYESVAAAFTSNGADDVTFTVTKASGAFTIVNSMVITAVPEPGSLVLLVIGLIGVLPRRRVFG
jgi:hypothetical protein